MDMFGELSPCRDLGISAKPGGGFHCCVLGFPGSVFILWLETVNELPTGVVVVGFAHPILQVTEKEPQGWVLLFLLQLCSHVASGSRGSEGLDEDILTQCDGMMVRTSSSLNDISCSMDSLNSCMYSANWPGWPGRGS